MLTWNILYSYTSIVILLNIYYMMDTFFFFFLYVYTRKIYFILFIVFILVYITLLNSLKLFSIKSRVRHTHIYIQYY